MQEDKYKKEREILAQIYANKANSLKYLLFFFKNRKELVEFFDAFGGKTLKIPSTFEDYIEFCLKSDDLPNDINEKGINEIQHNKSKDKIIQAYLRLYDSLENAVYAELRKQ